MPVSRATSRPLVTLLTDFGDRDGYVGAMKGVILGRCPEAQVVDLAHGIPPQDVAAGARALAQAARYFPAGTIHVAVVDPGVGSAREAVVVEAAGQLFVGPDNGLLHDAAVGTRKVFRIENPAFLLGGAPSATFHGRDVFAPTAGALAAGAQASDAGPARGDLLALRWTPPVLPAALSGFGRVAGSVTGWDRFGNAITSLRTAELPRQAGQLRFALFRGAERLVAADLPFVRTYAEVAPGAPLVYVGSDGAVEVAVRNGDACAAWALRRGDLLVLLEPDEDGAS